MKSSSVLPNNNSSEYGYGLAYKIACEQLASIENIEKQCHNSDARYELIGTDKAITVDYLNQPYIITLPCINISHKFNHDEVKLKDKILILHYLTKAKGIVISGKTITYKELPEGVSYYRTFRKRAIQPLLTSFGKDPHRLLDAVEIIGGRKADYGDVAVTINAFKRVPITLILWRGDEEFPPEGNIIFDSTITDYLAIEDINVLCETIAWTLVRSAK
ncbi:DUF3786 domain-containing protein [Chloroflexota bacterium]